MTQFQTYAQPVGQARWTEAHFLREMRSFRKREAKAGGPRIPKTAPKNRSQLAVEAVLGAEPKTSPEIAMETGHNSATIRKRLCELWVAGKVVRAGKPGNYRWSTI